MEKTLEKNIISRELTGTILIVVLVSIFVLSNFIIGFSLPIYFAAMLPAFFLAIANPKSAFYATIFLTFIFERFFTLSSIMVGRDEYKLYPLDILMLAMVIGIALSFLKGKIKISFEKIDLLLAIFILVSIFYGFLSLFFLNGDSALSFSSMKNYAFYAILYFIAFILIKDKKDFIGLLKTLVVSGISIIGFLAYGIINREGLWSEYTPLSTDGIRILAFTHGFYLSMILIVALTYLLISKNRSRFSDALLLLVPFWALGIIGSMMRHLWISLALAMAIVLVLAVKRASVNASKYFMGYLSAALFLMLVVFYAASMFPNSSLSENISEITETIGRRVTSIADSSDESIFWRNVVWREALKKYAETPIMGIGFGQRVSVEIGSYREFVEVRNIHNSFLIVLVQMGVLGTVLLIALLISLIKRLFLNLKNTDGFEIARYSAGGILILHCVAFVFQPYLEANLLGIFFWINLGIIRSLTVKSQLKATI